jgi:ubiquinone/menaquinone biosynthesis C-methylase UbiE
MAPFNHFDFLAPYYDRFIKPIDFTRLSDIIRIPTSGKLLDVGGGTGAKSFPLRTMVSGIVIADSSIGMLSQAGKKVGLVPVCSESERLPFADESFERVIMVDAFHHVCDYRLTARELWRVVKPGGLIVIEEPDIRTASIKIMAIIEKLALMRSHFIPPQVIAESFPYSNAVVNIEVEKSVAWIKIDKQNI